ncbi:IS200/IS605 family transposase [uncultured Desulfobacter sp.]|uniref:IS200/IS605 family transposase n=1 Tax=uncultured Desulfobacter sp. TaxID=240139 RepID=UPI002AA7B48D|nr:IS200/IS605 family transposase [uncultured Desulfobacter sp.]
MKDYKSLKHSKWYCKYHVVWIPKYRKKVIYGQLRRELGSILHGLAKQKECEIEEGHLMTDHVHMLISIPPKFAVAQVVGFIKGKSAIQIARQFCGKKRNYNGEKFGARGYFASTVGIDEQTVRAYIRHQEKEDQRCEQMDLFD